MKQQTDNELIAEFMGFIQKSYTPESEKLWCDNKHGLPVGELKFDTSWDWLMPSWVKFRDLKKIQRIEDGSDFYFHRHQIGTAIIHGTITEAFEELIKGIKWYNQQSK